MLNAGVQIFIWLMFNLVNIFLADQNDIVRRNRIATKNPKQIEHFWYGIGYAILCAIPFYWYHSFFQFFSLTLLHASIFAVFYNLYSDQITVFYLSKTTTSIIDRFYIKIGLKSLEYPVILFYIASIALLIISIIKA